MLTGSIDDLNSRNRHAELTLERALGRAPPADSEPRPGAARAVSREKVGSRREGVISQKSLKRNDPSDEQGDQARRAPSSGDLSLLIGDPITVSSIGHRLEDRTRGTGLRTKTCE